MRIHRIVWLVAIFILLNCGGERRGQTGNTFLQNQNGLVVNDETNSSTLSRSFHAKAVNEVITDPGEMSVRENVSQLDNQKTTGYITGDCEGTFHNVFYVELFESKNPTILQTCSHRGVVNVSITELYGEPVQGTLIGYVNVMAQFDNDGNPVKAFRSIIRAQGTGDLEGLILSGSFVPVASENDRATFEIEGRIHKTAEG